MTRYVATVNVPGYLPMDDDPPLFDTAQEAWDYLHSERERGEDDTADGTEEEYTDTREELAVLATAAHWQVIGAASATAEWLISHGLTAAGTGTVYGDTPGYGGDHDLGLAYSVSVVEEEECGGECVIRPHLWTLGGRGLCSRTGCRTLSSGDRCGDGECEGTD